jgi:hypothetical protein
MEENRVGQVFEKREKNSFEDRERCFLCQNTRARCRRKGKRADGMRWMKVLKK